MRNNAEILQSYLKDIIGVESEIEVNRYGDYVEESYYVTEWGLEINKEYDKWVLYGEKEIPQTYWEPADVDVYSISEHKMFWDAMYALICAIIKCKMELKDESDLYMEFIDEYQD